VRELLAADSLAVHWAQSSCHLARASLGTKTWCMATYSSAEDMHISGHIQASGVYGHHDLFRKIFAALPEHMFVDVGANIGFHTFQAAAMTTCRTVAFEPNPCSAAMLRQSQQLNCLSSEIALIEAAAGSSPGGHAQIAIHRESPGMTTLANMSALSSNTSGFAKEDFVAKGSGVRVDVTTVDAELLRLRSSLLTRPRCSGNISLVKIDVEGFEEFALRGARRLLRIGEDDEPDMFLFNPPLFVHVEVFPAMMHAAGGSPNKALRMLSRSYDLFVGLGEGPGGSGQRQLFQQMNLRHHHRGVYVLPGEGEAIARFLAVLGQHGSLHVDVFGQWRGSNSGQWRLPDSLDMWRATSVLLSR